jgi:uncharacterized membrane protein YqjE
VSAPFSSPGTLAAGKRVLVTLLSMVQTRLEMAAVELGDEKSRLLSLIFTGLAAFLLLSFAVLLASLLVVAWFWDTHRMAALGGLSVFYALLGAFLWRRLQFAIEHQPPAFAYTLGELAKDRDALAASARADEVAAELQRSQGGV